jgi:hypothetical protein
MRVLLFSFLFLGGMSCALRPSKVSSAGHSPLAWRLVEAPAPGGRELVLEAYDPTGRVRITIRFAQERASVGEVVEAEVRLPEASGLHRLEIVPDRPGVVILGAREFWTDGSKPVTARFTCTTPGRGGISVLVKE